jgi:hypothetical protein
MHRQLIRFLALIGALLLGAASCYAQSHQAEITFDNKSGQPALVKLIGPTRHSVQVPDGQERMVRAIGGQYYILTRYGSDPDHYAYAKGDPFTAMQTRTQYSIIRITLHQVVNGNYHTSPINASDFDKEPAD